MKIYLPKTISNSPTKLPTLEKLILYYIIHKSFKYKCENSNDLNLEIKLNELLEIINQSTIELIDIKSQIKNAINNLINIKLSLVDSGFHIKLSPIESVYLDSTTLYTTPNPIIVEYLDQISLGNFVVFDLLTNSVIKN